MKNTHTAISLCCLFTSVISFSGTAQEASTDSGILQNSPSISGVPTPAVENPNSQIQGSTSKEQQSQNAPEVSPLKPTEKPKNLKKPKAASTPLKVIPWHGQNAYVLATPPTWPETVHPELASDEWNLLNLSWQQVKHLNATDADAAPYIERATIAIQKAHPDLTTQYFVIVDRAVKRQKAAVALWSATDKKVYILGFTPVSTGKNGDDHFLTPIGFFQNSMMNHSYRAEGTLNGLGILGLGLHNQRVYDLGWIESKRLWGDKHQSVMRLMMHNTDPRSLEARLGTPQSKGCIRIHHTFDQFLDHYGIIDFEYIAQHSWILPKDQHPVTNPGSWIWITDSTLWAADDVKAQNNAVYIPDDMLSPQNIVKPADTTNLPPDNDN